MHSAVMIRTEQNHVGQGVRTTTSQPSQVVPFAKVGIEEFGRHAQQLYEELRARGLHSPARVEALFAGERIEDLQATVDQFDNWLQSNGGREPGYLARNGADVLLMALLRDSSQEIVDRHPAGRGQGRPPRIAWLARRYLAMRGAV